LTDERMFYKIDPMLAADSTLPSQPLPGPGTGEGVPALGRGAPSLYRPYFTQAECRLIDSTPLGSALNEISLIRIMLLRILAAAHRMRKLTLEHRLAMLQAFSHAGLVMASLVRVHHRLFPPTNPLLDALAEMDPDDI
jgi:hypothetical protein